MMLLEFIGIIGAAVAVLAVVGMVAAGASVVLLSLAGFLKELLSTSRSNRESRSDEAVMKQVA